jgi:hypothetical protein
VKSRLLLDVVVGERAAVLELLAREDQTLLIGRDAYRVGRKILALAPRPPHNIVRGSYLFWFG